MTSLPLAGATDAPAATHCTVHLVDQPASEHHGKPVLLVRDVLGEGIDPWCATCTERHREGAPLVETPFALLESGKVPTKAITQSLVPDEPPAPLERLQPCVVLRVDDVAPEALADSPFQPREVYDTAHIRSLADSMEDIGWIGTVRAREITTDIADETGSFERLQLIFGHCRKRGAQLAPLETIKVEVVRASDEQVLQMIAHENLDRRNLHPLDEGNLFASWLGLGRTLEQVVDRSGCSLQFVRTRLRLLDLVPDARKAFRSDVITLGHAKQLAGLQQADQVAALAWIEAQQRADGRQPSAAQLEEHITNRVLLTLSRAPWELHDAGLLPKAGACSTCPKRTGATPELFPGASDADRCADPACYAEKRAALLELRKGQATAQAEKQAEGKPDAPTFALALSTDFVSYGNAGQVGKKVTDGKPLARDFWQPVTPRQKPGCTGARAAYVDHGPEDLGRVLDVCVSGSGCAVHWPDEEASSPEAKEEKKKQREAERLAAEVRRLTILGVSSHAVQSGLEEDDYRCIARALWQAVEPDVRKSWAELHGFEAKEADDGFIRQIGKLKAEELDAVMLQVALVQDTLRGGKELAGAAKRAGVVAADVAKTARDNLAPASKASKAEKEAKAESAKNGGRNGLVEPAEGWVLDALRTKAASGPWKELARKGAKSADVRAALGRCFGISGSTGGPGKAWVSYWGGTKPRLLVNLDNPGPAPATKDRARWLEGAELVAAARWVFQVPEPGQKWDPATPKPVLELGRVGKPAKKGKG